jgi:hypothetical protein
MLETTFILYLSPYNISLPQLMSMFFNPASEDEMQNMTSSFTLARNACSAAGGISSCDCSTEPGKLIDIASNATETFFCLPKECSCSDGSLDATPPMAPGPIAENYLRHLNRMCDCQAPDSCTCQRKSETRSEISGGPFNFNDVHGCVPDMCMCANATESKHAPKIASYLKPMAEALKQASGQEIGLVSVRSQETVYV